MNQEAVWTQLTEVFREIFDDEEIVIGPETTAEDIEEWDSLSNIQLIVAIEQAFAGVKFNTGQVANLKNVGELAEVIAKMASG